MMSLRYFIETHSLLMLELPILLVIIILAKIILLRRLKSLQPKVNTSAVYNETQAPSSVTVITSQDIKAIAGDDVMVTQLDLARAYIELGKKSLAKQILNHVLEHGSKNQQDVARQLIESII